ncbi:MAG: endonuclease MutS2 [Candidatus Cloacimonetes bacterium]|nr:endonuclease MutS2 [Candidatus Cloacimonadota bacterium]
MSSLEQLEFDKVRMLIARQCHSDLGQKLCYELYPLQNRNIIEERLLLISQAQAMLKRGVSFDLSSLTDLRILFEETRHATFNYPEFKKIYSNVRLLNIIHDSRESFTDFPELQALLQETIPDPALQKRFEEIFDPDGNVRDTASPELRIIRDRRNGLRIQVTTIMNRKLEEFTASNFLHDQIITERNGRYVIPLKEGASTFAAGIVHGRSSSRSSVYIEPAETVPLNNDIELLDGEEKEEIYRICKEYTTRLRLNRDQILKNSSVLQHLDFLFASARFALHSVAVKPQIVEEMIVELQEARHPLLIDHFQNMDRVIPFSLSLGKDHRILLISGPNTGGKTVTLKSVGLLVIMALSGLPIPAGENSRIGMINNIYADIGDNQSLESSLSTFSSHMGNIREMLERGDENTLVLIDEIGAATDPEQGSALAQAILEKLTVLGVLGIITTHYTALKIFAENHPALVNAAMQFDPQKLTPTYQFKMGLPGDSFAIEVAAELGLEAELIARAKILAGRQNVELTEILRKMAQEKNELARQNYQYKLKVSLLDMKISEHDRKLADLDSESKNIRKKSVQEARDFLTNLQKEFNEELRNLRKIDRASKKELLEKSLHKAVNKNLELQDFQKELSDSGRKKLVACMPGMKVWIADFEAEGEVVEVKGDQIKIAINGLYYTTELDNLYEAAPGAENKDLRAQRLPRPAPLAKFEIKLLGYRFEEALPELDTFIDQAYLGGLDMIRIVHGKGTGALRNKIRKYLRTHNLVREFYSPAPTAGGEGVTIAVFKE